MNHILFFDSIKNKLNSNNHALEIQDKVIEDLKKGNSFHEIIKDNKEIIVKWYNEGRRGKDLYSNFYNQLNELAADDLIFEDLSAVLEIVKESNKFISEDFSFILFNGQNKVYTWYRKGRDGDSAYKWFYEGIKKYAYDEIIEYDSKLLTKLLDDGIDLKVALNSPKLFLTKSEFKNINFPNLKKFVEDYSKKSIIEGLNMGEQFSNLINDENIYNTPEEILEWYRQGRNGNGEHKEFYNQIVAFVVKQDYDNIREVIIEGSTISDIRDSAGVISTEEEFKQFLSHDGNSLECDMELDAQKAILNSCKSGISFKEAIKNYVFKFSEEDIKKWYNQGMKGNSRYVDFFNNVYLYVLKDDCEEILNHIERRESLNEAIENANLISPKDTIKQLYSQEEFEGALSTIIKNTINVLIFNTNYSHDDFNFNADEQDVNQWIELGKMNIKPFKEFYDNYLIYKTQIKVIESIKTNKLFKNAILGSDLAYTSREIVEWFFKGKNGEKFVEFYNQCSKFVIEETKQGILDYLKRYHSFNQAIKKYNSLYSDDEIQEWFIEGKNGKNHTEFYQQCMEIMNQFKDEIGSLDELLTPKYEEKLKTAVLTVEDYDTIIEEICQIGKCHEEFSDDDSVFNKISKIVSAYANWNYKSKGGESGYYKSNFIGLDDRLVDSQKIATLIHELAHHLVAEIIEISLCNMLNVEKTQSIEAFAAYFLTDPLSKILNEYCASTVEGRFIPHGFQNYGSYEMIFNACEVDDNAKELYKYIGNTLADDIISILENFIDFDLREEIKAQFAKDGFPPRYLGINYECIQTVPKDTTIALLSEAIIDYYNLAKESDNHRSTLKIAYDSFDASYS